MRNTFIIPKTQKDNNDQHALVKENNALQKDGKTYITQKRDNNNKYCYKERVKVARKMLADARLPKNHITSNSDTDKTIERDLEIFYSLGQNITTPEKTLGRRAYDFYTQ